MAKMFRFLNGLLVGGALGAVLVLLMTPQSGDETVAMVRERVERVLEDGRRAAAERRSELEAQFAEAKRPVTLA